MPISVMFCNQEILFLLNKNGDIQCADLRAGDMEKILAKQKATFN